MVADRVHAPVWTLEDAPSWWLARIYTAIAAENGAAAERRARDERRQRMQRGR